jgi:perosamine synthetase
MLNIIKKIFFKNTIKKIPQFKSFVDNKDYKAIKRVFSNNYIAEGPVGEEFKNKLLNLIGAKYGVLAPNGTLALYLALKASGIKKGDEIIVQNSTFIASANAIEMVGATPIFVDILSKDNASLDLNKIKLNKSTKGIMICHLFGTVCTNTEEVASFCETNNLLLFEDAAQTIGIKNKKNKKHCGTFGKVGTFSFYADKTITTGEGGFVVTDDEKIYTKMLFLRNQGRKNSGTFVHPEIGYNFRLTDIQSALGLSQLSKLNHIIQSKQKIYEIYQKYLNGKVNFLHINDDFDHIPFRVVVLVENAESTIKKMTNDGIEGRSVFFPLSEQPCFENFDNSKIGNFNNSKKFYEQGICLPTWIGLSEKQIKYISISLIKNK